MPGTATVTSTFAAMFAAMQSGNVPAPPQEPASTAPPVQNAFNPQISIVADTRAVLRDNDHDEETINLREFEVAFASDIDPFLRAEAYVAIATEDGATIVELEEAFGIYSNLGRGLSGKFGKIAGAVGRIQRNHADALQFLDYPLVIQNFLGDEGLRAGGASLSYLFPSERFMDVTVEALVPAEDGPIFMGSRTSDPVVIAHFRTFHDFNEDLSGQLGLSYANGPSSDKRASLWGLDYTMKWQPGTAGKSWQLETEAYWADAIAPGLSDTNGWFAAITTELRPRLFATGKYDFVEIPGTADDLSAWSAGLTLKVTEFHHWRLEFQHFDHSVDGTNDRLTLQFQWAMGPHPAHKY